MTNRIWKLLGYLLIACLLLSGVSALAEKTGTLNVTLNPDPKTGFTFIEGVTIQLYKIGVPDGEKESAWGPAEDFATVDLLTKAAKNKETKLWSTDEIDAIIAQVKAALKDQEASVAKTDENGKITFTGLVPGIYYGMKPAGSYPQLLDVTPFLIAVPALNNEDPYVIDANVKYTYTPPVLSDYQVTKEWRDDDNFDGIRPEYIEVKLQRTYDGKPDTAFNNAQPTVQITAKNNWVYTWHNLPKTDEDKKPYVYSTTEQTRVYGYTDPIYGDHVITNPHTPDYGCLEVTKAVTVGGQPTTTNLVDGVYAFTITGPTSYKAPKTKNDNNYKDAVPFSITIIGGEMVDKKPVSFKKLMPGTYVIKEVGKVENNQIVPLPANVESTASSGVEVEVTAENTEQAPKTITITNNLNAGSLTVSKAVTLNGASTTDARINGTYKFTVTGPNNYTRTFEIEVKNGKSTSKVLTDLVPGEYTVTEDSTGLPAGVNIASGSGIAYEVKAGENATATVTNNLGIGSLKITKSVTVNGRATTTTQADGTYNFTVTGPSYPSGHKVSVTIKNGAVGSAQLDNLLAGAYTVAEDTSSLPSGMMLTSQNNLRLNVTGNTVTDASFTNDRSVTTPTPTPGNNIVVNPTPTPLPNININGQKIWNDEGNRYNTRPTTITVQLLRNGVVIREINVTGNATANRWTYRFTGLPQMNAQGVDYEYTVRETPVAGYTTTVDGFTITNNLIPQTPREYTNFTGNKIWDDSDNADGSRPNYIIVRLLRNGEEVDRRTVTAANSWQFTFQNMPLDDGYGNTYTYTIVEDAVPGYVTRIDGFTITNSRLPEFDNYGTPLGGMDQSQLEDMLELYDYDTPLWGRPLKTGDEMPLYPIIFGGIGGCALIALIILMVINKKKGKNAA